MIRNSFFIWFWCVSFTAFLKMSESLRAHNLYVLKNDLTRSNIFSNLLESLFAALNWCPSTPASWAQAWRSNVSGNRWVEALTTVRTFLAHRRFICLFVSTLLLYSRTFGYIHFYAVLRPQEVNIVLLNLFVQDIIRFLVLLERWQSTSVAYEEQKQCWLYGVLC